jgi:hypothetical protein
MNRTMRSLVVGLVLLALAPARPMAAEDAPPSPWKFEFALPVWIPGNFGTIDVKGHTAAVDVPVGDVLQLLFDGDALAGEGYFSASYDRFSIFVDAFGGFAKESAQQKIPTPYCTLCLAAKADLWQAIVDVGFGYRLGQWTLPGRQRPLTLGVYAGTRYMHFATKLHGSVGVVGGILRSPNVSDTFNWADPMIGIRWEVPLLDNLSLDFRGDIGGFGASSDLIWGLVGGVRYWLSWKPWSLEPWLGAGYRALAFDRSPSADANLDMQFRGPYLGLGFVY